MSIKTGIPKELQKAIRSNDLSGFQSILQKKGWPKNCPWSGYNLLVYALHYNRYKIAKVIIGHGARVWNPSVVGNSPLHLCVARCTSINMIAKLLEKGASVSVKNQTGDSALHVAFNRGASDKKINMLLRAAYASKVKENVTNLDGLTFLHIACTSPYLSLVEVLADGDVDVNAQVSLEYTRSYSGYTALHFALDNARLEIAEYLVRKGADVCKQDRRGTTPLHLALRLRDVRMIDLLLSHDHPKDNIVNDFGLSHFMVACAGSKKSVVAAYITELRSRLPLSDMITARVEKIEECRNYTPLHFAVDLGQAATVEYLLEVGADCCAVASNDMTPHVLAAKREHKIIDEMLQLHCRTMEICAILRSQDADFNAWGDEYEKSVLIERIRDIKQLRTTFKRLKTIDVPE